MTALPAPPKTLEEFPDAFIAAWRGLCAEISDYTESCMRRCWSNNSNSAFGHDLKPLVKVAPLADTLPGWREAVLSILSRDIEAQRAHAWFITQACINLLCADEVLGLPVVQELLEESSLPLAWMNSRMPRSPAEMEALAALVGNSDKPAVQAAALDLLARKLGHIADARPEHRQARELLQTAVGKAQDAALHRFTEQLMDFDTPSARKLAEAIDHPRVLIDLAERGEPLLASRAIGCLSRRLQEVDAAEREALRPRVLALAEKHPVAFAENEFSAPWTDLAQIVWRAAMTTESESEERRKLSGYAIEYQLQLWRDQTGSTIERAHPSVQALQQFLAEDRDGFADWFCRRERNMCPASLDLVSLELLWAIAADAMAPRFIDWIAYHLASDSDWPSEASYDDELTDEEDAAEEQARQQALRQRVAEIARRAIGKHPDHLKHLDHRQLLGLLQLLPEPTTVRSMSPALADCVGRHKSLRQALPKLLADQGSALLAEAGWLDDARPGVRAVGLEALLLCEDAEATERLQALLERPKTTDADRDRIRHRLRSLGVDTGAEPSSETDVDDSHAAPTSMAGVPPADLGKLGARAAKVRIKAAVDKVWSPDLAALLAPLEDNFGRWLLSLASETKEDALTETALGLLAHVPARRRSELAEHVLGLWLANNGDRKLAWLLLFIGPCGDDRLVEPLFEAFKGWHKRAKPKAVTALKTLGRLDTAYALSHVFEVSRKSSYSDMIHEGAMAVLKSAAQRRGCDLAGLADEITPDFGLSEEGRVFDLGPHAYTLRVGTDLELSFTHSITGKTSKTLPKAKDGEDANARAEAEAAIKLLRGGLKKVVKLQAQRLEDAMVLQRTWPAARWGTLFVEHAVLGLIGQGLIWERMDAQGESLGSFRISEDRSLIDAGSKQITLDDKQHVRLWHPAKSAPAEVEAWTTHLADYEIKPFLSQVGRPVITLTAEEAIGTQFKRFEKIRVAQSTIKYGLEGWNYQISDQDGAHIGGFERRFENGLRVLIDTEDMDASLYGDSGLGSAVFLNVHQALQLADVPAPLLSLVAEHLEKLAAKAAA